MTVKTVWARSKDDYYYSDNNKVKHHLFGFDYVVQDVRTLFRGIERGIRAEMIHEIHCRTLDVSKEVTRFFACRNDTPG